jgi:hypothetical protein
MTGIGPLVRLNWKRLARGRLIWVAALLLVVPFLAVAGAALDPQANERLLVAGEASLRSLVLLAPVLLLAGFVADENEARTYTYLWSRPIRRQALAVARLLAVTPALAVLAAVAVGAALALAGIDAEGAVRALAAAALGVVAASAFAIGIGALFPRHPIVVALGWVFFAEQILSAVPAVQNLSVLHHVEVIAQLPGGPSGSAGRAACALALLTALWLGLAWWRLDRIELGSAEG